VKEPPVMLFILELLEISGGKVSDTDTLYCPATHIEGPRMHIGKCSPKDPEVIETSPSKV
jgi:hypothetical protein